VRLAFDFYFIKNSIFRCWLVNDFNPERVAAMIKHIVLWKLKNSAEGASKEENTKKMKTGLEALKAKIPQIRHLEVGINMVPSDAAYDVALYSEFVSEKDLDSYQKHPEHVRIADFIGKIRESRVVIDYKTD
jgi:Stress responsive A/B Barrel Domain